MSIGIFLRAPEAQDIFYVENVHVEENEQRKGLGRYLMARTHWEIQQKGYRFVALHARTDNYRAHLLYTSMGYRIVDTTMTLMKKLPGNGT